MAFQCIVVTPEQQVLDERIVQAIVPAHDGLVGIMTDRAPLLVKLGLGELRLDFPGGQKRTMFINGGVAQMKDNRLTILTNEAIAPEDINAESARSEFAEAAAQRTTEPAAAADIQRRMQRARVLQQMASK